MKKLTTLVVLGVTSAVTALPALAEGGPDFSGITGAVAVTTVVAGITAVAAIKILPPFTRWAYNQVITFFR